MINIITSFYTSKLDSKLDNDRNNELQNCLQKNIENQSIEKIHLYIDDDEAYEYINKINSDKINIIQTGKKPMYSDLFNFALQNLKDKICMITNSDIYIESCDLSIFNKLNDNNTVFALTRHEHDLSSPLIDNYPGSHDSFIFKSPLNNIFLENIQHYQHIWGAENVLLYELNKANIKLYNPCRQIKIVHLHKSNLREKNRMRINTNGRSHKVDPSFL